MRSIASCAKDVMSLPVQIHRIPNARNERVNITVLLPADYCQRGLPFTSSGGRTELVWKLDTGLGCKALRLIATQAHPIGNVQLGKMAVVRTATQNIYGRRLWGRSAPVFGLRMHQGGFQNLDGVLAPVQGSDRVHIEIHT